MGYFRGFEGEKQGQLVPREKLIAARKRTSKNSTYMKLYWHNSPTKWKQVLSLLPPNLQSISKACECCLQFISIYCSRSVTIKTIITRIMLLAPQTTNIFIWQNNRVTKEERYCIYWEVKHEIWFYQCIYPTG